MRNRFNWVATRQMGVAILLMGVVSAAVSLPAHAAGGPLDTVNWAPDGTVDGTGTGTLGGTTNVTYITNAIFNASQTFSIDWDSSLATDGAVGSGATNLLGGAMGASLFTPTQQTITFDAPVINPILLVDFTDAGDSMDFGPLSIALLDSNNASLVGSTMTFAGSTDSADDGFALQIFGSFGSGVPLTFQYISSDPGANSVAFTIGVPSTAPEPGTFALLLPALGLIGTAVAHRKRITAA